MLDRIRALVRSDRIRFSGKAAQSLMEGPWTLEDFRHSILCGHIDKRERDETRVAKYKYVIIGPALNGTPLYSCGKIIKRAGMEYFVITFHKVR